MGWVGGSAGPAPILAPNRGRSLEIESNRPLPSQDKPRSATEPDGVRAELEIGLPGTERWITLRQAEAITGVAVSTLRNWARKGKVASRVEERNEGPRRMVDVDGVVKRAQDLGRLLRPGPPQHQVRPLEPRRAPTQPEAPPPPEGHMLVPLEAWERMLLQLGNLHEAGQQMAEARERAAKAETAAGFLRERLSELRAERDQLRERVDDLSRPAAPEPAPPRTAPRQRPLTPGLVRRFFARWTSRPRW